MRRMLIRLLSLPVTLLFRLTRPIGQPWKRVYFHGRLNSDVPGTDASVQCDGRVIVTGTRNVSLGKRCRLGMETELRTMEEGQIRLGDDTRINRGCTLTSYSEIFIGDFTIIGEYVSIRDANHGMDPGQPMRYQPHHSAPIRIGRDVWIGRGCCILAGVEVGEGAVVGANSVVNKDVPPFSIVGGVPAKVIKVRQ